MKNPNLVDEIAREYYKRFGCNCTREEALSIISKEKKVTKKEVNESITMIQELSSMCYDKLKEHIEVLMTKGTESHAEPNLDSIFASLPFDLSTESKNEIVRYANWCISKV